MNPGTLLICLEKLRTLVEFEDTLCFHLADKHHEKFPTQQWLQLLAIIFMIFCCEAEIRLLEKHTYSFENHLTALSVVHDWSRLRSVHYADL